MLKQTVEAVDLVVTWRNDMMDFIEARRKDYAVAFESDVMLWPFFIACIMEDYAYRAKNTKDVNKEDMEEALPIYVQAYLKLLHEIHRKAIEQRGGA